MLQCSNVGSLYQKSSVTYKIASPWAVGREDSVYEAKYSIKKSLSFNVIDNIELGYIGINKSL